MVARKSAQPINLYGAAHSLYTGRARSYLIKAGIPYVELATRSPHYRNYVLPRAGQRQSLPTVELADGRVIRDGAAIIDHFEELSNHPFSPETSKQRVLSLLFDVIGAEGLLRPAMHYRWSFPKENREFLKYHFYAMMPDTPDRSKNAEAVANLMRDTTKILGVNPTTHDLIETLYLDVIHKLNRHFEEYPYLLGGKPCIGDFGLIAPLFGHLARDPKPLALMQTEAIHLYRWVERMNRPGLDVFGFDSWPKSYLSDDEIPDSLLDVLSTIAEDFVPETLAAANSINEWLEKQVGPEPGAEAPRVVGMATFDIRGSAISAATQPYRFYLLDRVQNQFELMDIDNQRQVLSLLEACKMAPILSAKLNRKICRQNNLEVWK